MKTRLMSAITMACVLMGAAISLAAQPPAKGKAVKAAPTTAIEALLPQPLLTTKSGVSTGTTSTAVVNLKEHAGASPFKSPNEPLAGEEINWDVLASGGGMMSSGSFILDGTLGQAVAGETAGPSSIVNAGFWQDFGPGDFLCGDVSRNNRVDITDAVFIIQYIFASGPAPVPLEAGDVDCNNRIAISDAVYIIQYIFASGPVPCAACR